MATAMLDTRTKEISQRDRQAIRKRLSAHRGAHARLAEALRISKPSLTMWLQGKFTSSGINAEIEDVLVMVLRRMRSGGKTCPQK